MHNTGYCHITYFDEPVSHIASFQLDMTWDIDIWYADNEFKTSELAYHIETLLYKIGQDMSNDESSRNADFLSDTSG